MTKKEQIEGLYRQGKTRPREIVALTGFSNGHVRTVLWNLRNPGALARYNTSDLGKDARRRWRKNHPDTYAKKKQRAIEKHQSITRQKAHNHRQLWTATEIEYLEQNGQEKSIRQMALELGRTYKAVHTAAGKFHVNLRGNKMGAGSNRFKKIYAEALGQNQPAAN